MATFVMNRDFVVSGMGHSVGFKKDVPIHVPPELHQEVMRCGATPVDGKGDVNHVEVEQKKAAELQGPDRVNNVIAAMDQLVEKNERMSFGADALPTMKAIFRLTGIELEMNERNDIWQKRMRSLQSVSDPSNATITEEEVAKAATAAREVANKPSSKPTSLADLKPTAQAASEPEVPSEVSSDVTSTSTTEDVKVTPRPPVKKKAARRK